MAVIHLVHESTGLNLCGMRGKGTTVRADITCGRCMRSLRVQREKPASQSKRETPAATPPRILDRAPLPGMDDRYAIGADGWVYSCAVRGAGLLGRKGGWRRLRENKGAAAVRRRDGRTVKRLARVWWRLVYPGVPWPREGVPDPEIIEPMHFRVDYEGAVWPACDEESEDARVTADRSRVTCAECLWWIRQDEEAA